MELLLPFLEKVLRSRIEIVTVHRQAFAAGHGVDDAIVPSARVLLAVRGQARYTVEGRSFPFGRGMMLMISAHTRRRWRVPRGKRLEIWWVEFQSPAAAPSMLTHLLLPACDVALERDAYRRLEQLGGQRDLQHTLEAEGELKALLARFLFARLGFNSPSRASARRSFGERAVVKAIEWLDANYHKPDAINGLPQRVGLSPNHFRVLFRWHFSVSAQQYLVTRRMHKARAMLRESARPVKEIAKALGYRDPLFFSRHYRKYWNHPPTRDRWSSP